MSPCPLKWRVSPPASNRSPRPLPRSPRDLQGENARFVSFMGAIAIADLVKTTLGPKGMDKILQSVRSCRRAGRRKAPRRVCRVGHAPSAPPLPDPPLPPAPSPTLLSFRRCRRRR